MNMIALGDPQQCLLFLRYCLGEKINHILRTTYPCLVEELAERFDIAKKKGPLLHPGAIRCG